MKRVIPLFVLLGLVLVVPRLVGAMPPPGGGRWWIFSTTGGGTTPVPSLTGTVYWHTPGVDLSNVPSSTGLSDLPGYISAQRVGQDVSFSVLLWFDTQPSVMPGTVQVAVRPPYLPSGAGSFTGVLEQPPYGYAIGNTSMVWDIGGNPITFTVNRLDSTGKSGVGPDLIATLTWRNPQLSPGVTTVQSVCADPGLTLTQPGGSPAALPMSWPGSCFTLQPPTNKIDVNSGDVAAQQVTHASPSNTNEPTLFFKNSADQVMVGGYHAGDCSYLGLQPNCDTHQTNSIYRANADTKTATSIAALGEAAARVATLGTEIPFDSANPQAAIIDFLTQDAPAWLYPRGQVGFINAQGNAIAINQDVTVHGKKLLIVDNGTLEFDSNVLEDPASHGLFAVILPANSANDNGWVYFRGNDQTFEGAVVAKNEIRVAGSGLFKVKGSLISQTVDFSVQTNTSGDSIASLTFDPRFQNGELIGLSSILLPLVTEGSF